MTGKRGVRALLAAVVLSAFTVGMAQAAGPLQTPVTVYPSDAQGNRIEHPGYWVVSAAPGSTTKLYAVVGDVSHHAATIRVLAVDAADGLFGGISYDLPNAPRRAVGAWVRLPAGKVSVDSEKGAVVPFTLVVPKGTKPGQYVGGVSAYVPSGIRQTSGHTQVIIQPRVVTAVQVNVPGPQFSRFSVANVKPAFFGKSFYVVAHIRNSGDTLLKGTGYLWVWQRGRSKPIIFHAVPVDTSLPYSTITCPFQWSQHPAKGTYRWAVKMGWTGGATSASGAFVVR
jgi:hypothetical protein